MSFVYERGWRQNFQGAGFPGPDEEVRHFSLHPSRNAITWRPASEMLRHILPTDIFPRFNQLGKGHPSSPGLHTCLHAGCALAVEHGT